MSLLHSELIKENKEAFLAKVIDWSKRRGYDPNWLMQVMWNETAHTMNHRIVNSIGAAGLIQFLPSTARALGTTTTALINMSNVQQLDYVFKYLDMYRSKIYSYIDMYFAVFFPLAIGKPMDWVFKTAKIAGSTIARQNPSFDTNKDGILTVREVQQAMLNKVPAAFRELFKKKT
jgi:hypothetical protein